MSSRAKCPAVLWTDPMYHLACFADRTGPGILSSPHTMKACVYDPVWLSVWLADWRLSDLWIINLPLYLFWRDQTLSTEMNEISKSWCRYDLFVYTFWWSLIAAAWTKQSPGLLRHKFKYCSLNMKYTYLERFHTISDSQTVVFTSCDSYELLINTVEVCNQKAMQELQVCLPVWPNTKLSPHDYII